MSDSLIDWTNLSSPAPKYPKLISNVNVTLRPPEVLKRVYLSTPDVSGVTQDPGTSGSRHAILVQTAW
ncbi:hypothetical protein RRG08_031529 [Elysia crispata]|uniref:Uncharacterized protein n=1 Tax=Elysia crispata TaxID=231223 RepID=A0AAE0Z5F8_9GAST|nr:hypothetical protein RRG08_031529 [Elysia crispata]